MPGDLSDEILERVLTGGFGRPRRVYEETDSTNAAALRWLDEERVAEGAVVIADQQTAGRGRWGRAWLSAPGAALMFSVVCRPQKDALRLLTTAAGCSVAAAVQGSSGLRAGLKWPNDVVLGGRKAAGILVETRTVGSLVDAAIVGIGINLRWGASDLPLEIAQRATSIAAAVEASGTGSVPSRAALLAASLASLEEHLALLGTRAGRAEVVARANALSCILDEEVTLRFANGAAATGVARRITDDGALELVVEGRASEFSEGEIETLRAGAGA